MCRIIYHPIFLRAKRILTSLAPPLLSAPRKVDAEAQAVETNSETVKPEDNTVAFNCSISSSSISVWLTTGTGSYQIKTSCDTI